MIPFGQSHGSVTYPIGNPGDKNILILHMSCRTSDFGKNYFSFLDFTQNYGILVPCNGKVPAHKQSILISI